MMGFTMNNTIFQGLACTQIDLGMINLLVTIETGPRIVSFKYKDSGNIFAELPADFPDLEDKEKYLFFGGHRLWISPETQAVTYVPDDMPVTLDQRPDGVLFSQATVNKTGMRKSIYLHPGDQENILIVDHIIRNETNSEVKLAPWAITQLKVGGTAILPYTSPEAEKNSYLPNRNLTLWPYTDPYDARMKLTKDLIFISPKADVSPPLKIGIVNFHKWIAYNFNGYLFIKYADNIHPDCSLDMGASGQCYCNNEFIELETLGAYQKLSPGAEVRHREVWRILEKPTGFPTPEAVWDFDQSDKTKDTCLGVL